MDIKTNNSGSATASLQFGIRYLLVITALVAVSSWLVSIGYWPLAVLWLSIAFSFEIGRRSSYSTISMMFCGVMLGILLAFAIAAIPAIQLGNSYGAIATMDRTKTLNGSTFVVLVGLDLTLWFAAFAIFIWFIFVAKGLRSESTNKQARQTSDSPKG